MDTRRSLDDPTPDEWTAVSRKKFEVGSKEWYHANEQGQWDGFFKGRDSAAFVPSGYSNMKEDCGRRPYVAGPQSAAGNPKARVGELKAPLDLVPPVAIIQMAMALKDGADKYGAFNYRSEPINVSTYVGAIARHMAAYQDGEDNASDSGVHHLSHVMACCGLLLDSLAMGILVDDRPPSSGAAQLLADYHQRRTL